MNPYLHIDDWITTRVESDGTTTHTVPMNEKSLEIFFRFYQIVASEKQLDGTTMVSVERKPVCQYCADWQNGICDNEDRELDLNARAREIYGTVEGVSAIAYTSPFFTCLFFRKTKRSDQEEFRRVCIPQTTRIDPKAE